MSYFEKIGNSISSKSKEIVQKAKDASEVSSLNSIIKTETQKIELNYKMMGKLYFEKYGSAPAEEFSEAVNAIKESTMKISQTQEMIKKIKTKRCCPNCMAPFKNGSQFCSKCGTKLVIEQEMPKTADVCPSCGAKAYEGALFCEVCGTKLDGTENTVKAEEPKALAVAEETVDVKSEEQENKICPSCGAVSEDKLALFCNDCGAKLG